MQLTRRLATRDAATRSGSLLGLLGGLVERHLGSQEVARRNAMVASTEAVRRRREREEVERFLARHERQYGARARRVARERPA